MNCMSCSPRRARSAPNGPDSAHTRATANPSHRGPPSPAGAAPVRPGGRSLRTLMLRASAIARDAIRDRRAWVGKSP
jgi:hypothetical protein